MSRETKGPKILTAEVIVDICRNRDLIGARPKLAKKHGISTKRIDTVWRKYYGGTTLADFKSGLKCHLPDTETTPTVTSINTRKVRTSKYELSAKEPENARASVQRKIDKLKKEPVLNLDEVNDQTAEIVAGEIEAGNDSKDLIDAMYKLMESNQQLSESAYRSLESAMEFHKNSLVKMSKIAKKNKNQNIDAVLNGYDSTVQTDAEDNIAETSNEETDESADYAENEQYEQNAEKRRESAGHSSRRIISNKLHDNDRPEFIQRRKVVPEISRTTNRERAIPSYKISGNAGAESEDVSGDTRKLNRTSSKIQLDERNASENTIQPNTNIHNNQLAGRPPWSISGQGAQRPWGNPNSLKRPI
jgi:hypothetical protein